MFVRLWCAMCRVLNVTAKSDQILLSDEDQQVDIVDFTPGAKSVIYDRLVSA